MDIPFFSPSNKGNILLYFCVKSCGVYIKKTSVKRSSFWNNISRYKQRNYYYMKNIFLICLLHITYKIILELLVTCVLYYNCKINIIFLKKRLTFIYIYSSACKIKHLFFLSYKFRYLLYMRIWLFSRFFFFFW